MVPFLVPKALWLRAEAEDAPTARRAAMALFFFGAIAALCYAYFAQGVVGRPIYLRSSSGLAMLGMLCFAVGRWRAFLTASGYIAIVLIAYMMSVPDPAATVPLFLLWPLVALAYFRRPAILAGGLFLSAVAFAWVLAVGATTESRIVYMGTLSTAFLLSGLVAYMRAAQLTLRARLERASHIDPLTGLLNRRAFGPAFNSLLDRPDRGSGDANQELSVVLLDIDHFKQFNDTHGHLGGDDALRRLARHLTAAAGPAGLICRHGGEEFVVALDRLAGAPTASEFTNALAEALATEAVDPARRFTVSCGAVTLTEGATVLRKRATNDAAGSKLCSQEALLTLADDALYAAKHGGRARTATWAAGRVVVDEKPARLRSSHVAPHATPELGIAWRTPWTDHHPGGAAPKSQRTRRPQDPRDVLIKRIVVTMFATGALNCLVALLVVDYTPFTERWQVIITAIAIVGAVVAAASPGSVRMAQVAGLWGAIIVAATMATIAPMISAPLFGVWGVVFVAYFCSRRFIVFTLVWCGVWFGAALAVLPADAPKMVVWSGTMVNVCLSAAVVGLLRFREERLRKRLELAADTDPLTGLLNRRAFGLELASALSVDQPLTVVMVDADHFKRYNDTHGHAAGDEALRTVSAALRDAARGHGFSCRFGGEEFAVALPGSTVDDARVYVERVARSLLVRFPDPGRGVTVSAGIALAAAPETQTATESEAVLARADAALYLAKAAGRARAAWPSEDGLTVVTGTPVETFSRHRSDVLPLEVGQAA